MVFGKILILIIVGACVLLVVALIKLYRTPEKVGKEGEAHVADLLAQLPSEYHVMNDVVFRTDKGTMQIDHIVVSKYGVFVIETKNYTGEIYGNDHLSHWTQIIVNEVTYRRKWYKTYTYVTKNQFYNPVKQAWGHVYRTKDLLKDYTYLPIKPVVVFAGDASLEHVESKCLVVYAKDLLPTIERFKDIYLSDTDTQKVLSILDAFNIRVIVENKEHVQNIHKEQQRVQNIINSGICPKCGGTLIKRNGKYGEFYGCSNYPKCRFIAK